MSQKYQQYWLWIIQEQCITSDNLWNSLGASQNTKTQSTLVIDSKRTKNSNKDNSVKSIKCVSKAPPKTGYEVYKSKELNLRLDNTIHQMCHKSTIKTRYEFDKSKRTEYIIKEPTKCHHMSTTKTCYEFRMSIEQKIRTTK